ncbi:hypothetical protein EVAR_22118_1 [Eumeta japonica]|uniref:Uncharacterized protein n=1 Tax=Eumeta variegata TaxID=151549 RepID=A0A4C1W227_EUMVA|nr:hypothetical protein EVAR_22118_1 [Eumeta japonica]
MYLGLKGDKRTWVYSEEWRKSSNNPIARNKYRDRLLSLINQILRQLDGADYARMYTGARRSGRKACSERWPL